MQKETSVTRRDALKIGSIAFVGTAAFGKVNAWGSVLDNFNTMSGIGITAQGSSVVVAPGKCEIGSRSVTVSQPATLTVSPAPVVTVTDEPIMLSVDKPAGWAKGTRLKGCNARDVNAFGSFVPGSLVIRQASLKAGTPHISTPLPPEAETGSIAIAHVFVNYGDSEVKTDQIYPILETAEQAVTASSNGLIPETLAKLRAGGSVKIVCWGDSVTAGGNASKPEFRYPDVFISGLRQRFPRAKIEMQNISAGGSNSRQWLYPDKFLYRGKPWQETGVTWQRIADAQPDLVTLEFVNDANQTPDIVEEVYSDILKRVQDLGAELILITPHFTMLKMMGFKNMREHERRPYVLALREFAGKHNIALADASARWEHLSKEGIPYLTLLNNTINHPDDRGHRLFAEELWACF